MMNECQIIRRRIQQQIMNESQIICATLSSASHDMLRNVNVALV
jgi:senataxin